MPSSGLPEVMEMIEQKRVPTAEEADVAAAVERASARKFLDLMPTVRLLEVT